LRKLCATVTLSGISQASTLHVPALQKAYWADVCFDVPATGTSITAKLRQHPDARFAGEQIHRIATSLTFADHPLKSQWPDCFETGSSRLHRISQRGYVAIDSYRVPSGELMFGRVDSRLRGPTFRPMPKKMDERRIARIRSRLKSLGYVEAPDEEAAIEAAAKQFRIPAELRYKLVAQQITRTRVV
jgi:hypothetical protein